MTDTATSGRIDFLNGQPVEGETLRARLEREMVSPGEALKYGLDIGIALSRAHAQGLVHGTVSPRNILLGDSGAVLLKPLPGEAQELVYRAPEQVLGNPPDARSDIFAFGVLLYEMASGVTPFRGEGKALDSAILKDTPPALASPLAVYQAMDKVIAGCIEKDPFKRRQRIQNAVTELKLTARTLSRIALGAERHALPVPQPSPRMSPPRAPGASAPRVSKNRDTNNNPPLTKPARPPATRPMFARAVFQNPKKGLGLRMWIVFSAVLLLCAASLAAVILLPGRNSAPVYRFSVAQEDAKYPGMPAVSPDGRNLSWSATGPEGKRMLWVQALDATHAKPVPNTEGASAPFWSPDSAYLAFFANGFLRKVRIQDGAGSGEPKDICPVDAFAGGGSWNADGTILFASSLAGGLSRVPAAGGAPRAATKLNAAKLERSHLWPQFLPDGKHFLFFVATDEGETTGVYAGSLDSPNYNRLFSSETNAVYAGAGSMTSNSGYLLFIRNSSLMGQPFNASRLQTTNDAMTLATNIDPVASLSLAQISVSGNGTLVYQSAGKSTRQLSWIDRGGKNLGNLGEPGDWGPPRISPDGKRVVAGRKDDLVGFAVLWVLDSADGSAVQLTHMNGGSASPVWSPDGSRIAFASAEMGSFDLFVQPANAEGKPELLYRTPHAKMFDDWSRDGKTMLFDELIPGMNRGLWMWNQSERKASAIVDTIHSEGYGALSPDGKWLAYQSDESGMNEVVVQSFDSGSAGTKRIYTISTATGGGGLPHWRRDGGELYYMTQPGKIFAATVHPGNGEFAFDPPHELFHTRPTPKSWNLYDVSPDGQRFLVNTPMDWPSGAKIIVTTSWLKELQ